MSSAIALISALRYLPTLNNTYKCAHINGPISSNIIGGVNLLEREREREREMVGMITYPMTL